MTTSSHDFFFGLLRISILQLLKAQGFDKTRSSTIDIVTDLYIKFLELLTSEIKTLILARCSGDDDSVALQDLTQAFVNLRIIKPVDILDVYDENPQSFSDKGFRLLKEWCLSSRRLQESRKVAAPPLTALKLEEIAGAVGSVDNDATINTANTTVATISNNNININNYSNNNNNNTMFPSGAPNSSRQAFPDYMGDLRANQEEELERRKEKANELIEELINNGDADDWIRLLVARQRLYLFHKKHNRNINSGLSSLPPGHSSSSNLGGTSVAGQSMVVPDIKSLPRISGLKSSVLASEFFVGAVNTRRNSVDEEAVKSNNEFLPFSLDPSWQQQQQQQQPPTGVNTNEGEWSQLSEGDIKRLKHATALSMSLPVMHPELRLDQIVLSFENDESLDSDSGPEDENSGLDIHETGEPGEDGDSNRNLVHCSNTGNSNGTGGVSTDGPNDLPSPGTGGNEMPIDAEFNNDIAFDEIADMNSTFQRRSSLDFGNPALY